MKKKYLFQTPEEFEEYVYNDNIMIEGWFLKMRRGD
ncbi:hypothetical protein SAMN05216352_106171 [Alteribacillus bidgolensis]|uniref:Uncharacterized protein n=1 Tax=Alteribacillus bidgolensis TaxID=930129 RepID=A0A1G8JF75_9BACI|nr:hypothetical protein SAMN05216352_106171 [Alteribacillus bidgolensis]